MHERLLKHWGVFLGRVHGGRLLVERVVLFVMVWVCFPVVACWLYFTVIKFAFLFFAVVKDR